MNTVDKTAPKEIWLNVGDEGTYQDAVDAETAVKDGERKIKDAQAIKKLFTHQKKWQRLSDNKITNLFAFYGAETEEAMMDFARAIEQALKDKNT